MFLHEGAKVFLVDLEEADLAAVGKSLESDDVAWAAADVSNPDDVSRYVDACVDVFGGIDILFDNAGIEGTLAPLTELSVEDFDRVMNVNCRGAWLGIKYAAPKMLERGGGSIIITSSVAGFVGSPGLGAYVTSKHGVIGLMQCAAQELGPQGIRVNTVNPGPVDNRMMRSIESQASPDSPDAVKAGFEGMVPLGRYATNEEVASMALFLASDDSTYCNGSTYVVDGGFLSA
jgi:NAD(P)-dependent dehydrogenase (short-subunit alcohol dehydrogenase family)